VPGNKDDRRAMRTAFPDVGWETDGPLNIARTIGSVRVIGLDVTVPGEKHGDAEPVLPWLRNELSRGEPALLFMHQHPFRTGFAKVDSAPCQNAEALAEVMLAGRSRVILLTTGHGHRTVFSTFADAPAMMCPSLSKANVLEFDGRSAPLVDPPGFALHVIENNRVMTQVIPLG
jgi:3',5'-cyclic-AMP phosphodiesterase